MILTKCKYNELKAGDVVIAITDNEDCWRKKDKFTINEHKGYKCITCKGDDTHYLDTWTDCDGYLVGLMRVSNES